jgi:L-ascorbate metabolism protein UlaG (beta-lactamase superfamily)
MSPLDALYAFEDLRARVMVPIHHGAFALSYERLGEPARWLRELVAERDLDAHVRLLEPGESAVWRAVGAP